MRWAVCFSRPSGPHDTPDEASRQTEAEETPKLTDAGLDRLVADILLLAEMDRILDDEYGPEDTPTGALTVPLSPRRTPDEHPENHINLER